MQHITKGAMCHQVLVWAETNSQQNRNTPVSSKLVVRMLRFNFSMYRGLLTTILGVSGLGLTAWGLGKGGG